MAGALVDEMDEAEIPVGVADLDAGEMAITVRHLEAAALDDDGAVALLVGAMSAAREGEAQRIAVGTRPRDVGPGEEARDRRLADLGVGLAVVLVLDPGLGGLVQEAQGQVRHVLQHGDQPALDRAPERLLLGVLIGAVGQRGVVQDAETGEPLGDLRGRHRGAVVAQRGARQAALLERLAEPVRDDLGGLGQIPLQVTGEARSDRRARRTEWASPTRRAAVSTLREP